jgi:ankyrin repeat protein
MVFHAVIDAQDKHGGTSLHFACRWGHMKTVELLLRRGADINAQEKHGRTPSDIARKHDHTEVIKLFPSHSENESCAIQ